MIINENFKDHNLLKCRSLGKFPKGTFNKVKLKKIGPSKILRKFSANAYEIELPSDLQISPIFNVSYLYPFKGSGVQKKEMISGEDGPFVDWKGKLPSTN